jgi:hypothetical protein
MYQAAIANHKVRCKATGLVIRTGEACAIDESGIIVHISQLPARRLIPLKEYLNGQHKPVQGNKSRIQDNPERRSAKTTHYSTR